MTGSRRTSIIIVGYGHAAYLPAAFSALASAKLDAEAVRILYVDNASEDGSAELVEALAPGVGVPVEVIRAPENLGFAGGNNLGIRRAIADGDELVYFLNPDTRPLPDFLREAHAALHADPRIALVQSLVLRDSDTPTINTFGNAFHFLGFGFAAGDGLPLDSPLARDALHDVTDIAVASGAASLARVSVLAELGGFEEELFLYHEDAELSLRARAAGHRIVLAPASRVLHRYDFARNPRKLYWLERNRWLVLAWHLDVRTLLALLPALTAVELGLLLIAAREGWLEQKTDAYRYFLARGRLAGIAATRRRLRALHRIGDAELTAPFTREIVFPAVSSWIVRRVANPVLSVYWTGVQRLLGF